MIAQDTENENFGDGEVRPPLTDASRLNRGVQRCRLQLQPTRHLQFYSYI
jgi:hypothetical protein